MVDIKKIKKILNSRFFLISFFSFIACSLIVLAGYKIFRYMEQKQNTEIFARFYDIMEKYQPALESNSSIPLEEIYEEIEKTEKNIGYFSTLKHVLMYIKTETKAFINLPDKKVSRIDELSLLKTASPFEFLYGLFYAIDLATQSDNVKKQEGILLLKRLSEPQKQFRDVALFYYGYFMLKTSTLRQADEIWYPLLNDPVFNASPYKELVKKARNLDF